MAKKSGSKRTTGKRKAVAQKKKPASKKSKTAGKKLVIKIGNKKLGRKQRKNAKKVEETSSEEEESEESSEEESSDEEETSDIAIIDEETVCNDMKEAGVDIDRFPITHIFGLRIGLKIIGLSIVETEQGVKVQLPKGRKAEIYKHLKLNDRILMVGDRYFQSDNTNIEEVSTYCQKLPRPILYRL